MHADLDELQRLTEQERAATLAVSDLERTVTLLDEVSLPEHVRPLDDDLAAAKTAHASATAALVAAEHADELARAALRDHEPRSRLEAWQQQHARRQQLLAAAPELRARVTQTQTDRTAAETARDAARTARDTAQQAERDAAAVADAADAAATAGQTHLDALQHVVRPAAVDELCQALDTATTDCDSSKRALTQAQVRQQQATAQRSALPSELTLERTSTALTSVAAARSSLSTTLGTLAGAHTRARADADTAATAERLLADAEQAADASHARHVAAQLRADLHAGDTCPVCDQQVDHAPAPVNDHDATTAAQNLSAARTAHTDADRTATRMAAALYTAAVTVRERHEELKDATGALQLTVSALRTPELSLPELPNLSGLLGSVDATVQALAVTTAATAPEVVPTAVDAVSGVLRQLDEETAALDAWLHGIQQRCADADHAVEQASGAARSTELAYEQATATLDTLSIRTHQARAELREVRDRLVPLGAPDLEDSDLPAAWVTLTAWAADMAAVQAQTVAAARQHSALVATAWQQTVAGLHAAQQTATTAETAYEDAVRAAEQAQALEAAAQTQQSELEAALAGAPGPAQVDERLATLTDLEDACATAEQTLSTCRTAASAAQQQLAALSDAQRAARAELATTRDPLVALGAPALRDDEGLVASWTRLLEWAQTTREAQQAALAAAHVAQDARTVARQTADDALRGVLAAAGLVEDVRPLASWAAAAVAGARADAAASVRAIEDARKRNASLQVQIRSYREQAVVAQQLGRLLATNAFPRWLSRSALQVLVVAASSTLMELSGGQFELAIADNETAAFTVIDHTDADAERGVKTLSGGETFQASLSLALALSTHLGALASNGAAQLEAIFIDEGFGTLDETTLDTVATTLETLAGSAGRMVGVITHVPQLAARVPVQFAVQRDPRGSSIVRVTP